MKLSIFLTLVSSLQLAVSQTLQGPPQVSPLFNVTLKLNPQQVGPIPVPGGVQVVRQVTSGVVSGAFEANITGGVVYPSLYQNQTVQVVLGNIWGETQDSDGMAIPFFATENGIGSARHFNRLTLDIGGYLANLSTAYIISSPTQIDATTILTQAYLLS